MKKILVVAMMLALASGCAKVTKYEPVIAASSRVAAGLVLDNNPELIPVVYAISLTALHTIDKSEIITVAGIDKFVIENISFEGMTPQSEIAIKELVLLVKDMAVETLGAEGVVSPLDEKVAVRKVVLWINQAAMVRMK